MIYLVVMFLLLIEKIILGDVYDSTEFDLESKLRDLLELEPREKSLVLRADTDNEPEDELPQEHAPFERYLKFNFFISSLQMLDIFLALIQ